MNTNDLSPQEAKDLRLLLEQVTDLREEQLSDIGKDFPFTEPKERDEIRGHIKREINIAKRVLAHLNQPAHTIDTPLQGTINIHDAFVTMTVPVSVAMRVADNELGDSHTDAVFNVEKMLTQDLEEEYGITLELAQEHHTKQGHYPLSCAD